MTVLPPLSSLPPLPACGDYAAFDALHDDISRWQPVITALAARHAPGQPVQPMSAGTVLVALVGSEQVIKLYPPFLRDHFEFEAAMLPRLQGRLGVPTPQLLDQQEHEGWPYLVMSQLAGTALTEAWPSMSETQKCALLESLGSLAAEVHALPVEGMASLAPAWPDFIARQRAQCLQRQTRTGLPAHLLAELEDFIAGDLPEGPAVMLTGEYTPMNLLQQQARITGMFDFGDGLVGPARYDWLGPLTFLAAGQPRRVAAFLGGYGTPTDAGQMPALRLLLLHRYSCLRLQIAHPGWQDAPSFEALAEMIWSQH